MEVKADVRLKLPYQIKRSQSFQASTANNFSGLDGWK